jgi:Cu(I)/Ag(I) efflux system membrane protein CusA/SilA
MEWKKTTLGINILALLVSIHLIMNLGREFMPPLDEGSLLFMPVTLPDISNSLIPYMLHTLYA